MQRIPRTLHLGDVTAHRTESPQIWSVQQPSLQQPISLMLYAVIATKLPSQADPFCLLHCTAEEVLLNFYKKPKSCSHLTDFPQHSGSKSSNGVIF